ncbi:senescence associated gene 20-like, partial [Wolffia australiana]
REKQAGPELANSADPGSVVRALYDAINARDVDAVHRLVEPDIEWWFHGPAWCQHLKGLLTGAAQDESFFFEPVSVAGFGGIVLVEGRGWARGGAGPVNWVHAWTVVRGMVTEVREYFNISLTVTRLCDQGSALWQSRLCGGAQTKSVPGLVLAI